MKSISVALATYNGEDMVEAQIRSILSQSCPPGEIIVSDDNSTDLTVQVIQRIKAEGYYTDIKIIENKERKGYTKNYENAIKNCSGEIIFLSDQDDFWFPGKIEKIMKVFYKNSETRLVYHDAKYADSNLHPQDLTVFEKRQHIRKKRSFVQILKNPGVKGCTVAFSADLKNKALPFVDEHGKDFWLVVIAAALGSIVPVSDTLMFYRRHSKAQTKDIGKTGVLKKVFWSIPSDKKIKTLKLLYHRISFLQEQKENDEYKNAILDAKKEILSYRSFLEKRKMFIEGFNPSRLREMLSFFMAGKYHRYSLGGGRVFLLDILASIRKVGIFNFIHG